jgi:hypothetical protein
MKAISINAANAAQSPDNWVSYLDTYLEKIGSVPVPHLFIIGALPLSEVIANPGKIFAVARIQSLLKTFLLAFVLAIGGICLTDLSTTSQPAYAEHKTNKWDVQRGLENGWIVMYSKEFSHAEYFKLSAAIAVDVVGGSGSVTSAYFQNFAYESRDKILKEIALKSPSIADQVVRELTLDKILSSIQASFNGRQVVLSIAGLEFQVGRATYNRSECSRIKECTAPHIECSHWWDTPLGTHECTGWAQNGCDHWVDTGNRCVDTPNTYQPYIRFKVASSNSLSNSNQSPQTQSATACSSTYDPRPYRPGTSGWTGRVGKIAFNNGTGSSVSVKLYHPDAPSRVFGSWNVQPGQNLFLGDNNYGMDWGIQVDGSSICIVGSVSDWNSYSGSQIFQTWVQRIR